MVIKKASDSNKLACRPLISGLLSGAQLSSLHCIQSCHNGQKRQDLMERECETIRKSQVTIVWCGPSTVISFYPHDDGASLPSWTD